MLFLRGVLLPMVTLLVLGAVHDPWSPEASGGERILRTALQTSLLLPGGFLGLNLLSGLYFYFL